MKKGKRRIINNPESQSLPKGFPKKGYRILAKNVGTGRGIKKRARK